MADWVRVFGVVGLWLILTAMFASVTHYFYQRLFDHRSVSVSIAKDKDRDVSAEFVARAHDLQKPMRLDRLREIHLPQLGTRFTRMETMFPAGMKFEVQGVDVTTVLRLLDSLFQRAPRRVEGQIATAEKSIQVSLTNPGRSEATTLRALTIYEKDPASELRLLDRAVLWNIYQLNYGLSPNRVRSESMNSTPAFPTAEALEAYYAGRWHLDVYQNAYSPEDLDRAESHFKTLREAMPRFRDGLLLLGVTLTEQRKEDEAIGVFEQIENDLPSPTDFRERRHLLEAQLLGAVAHRKRYKLADNHVAVQKLQYVATRANALVNDPQVAQWRVDFLRLYLEALVELCSALGHYQVLLNARNFGSELISIDAPPEIQLNPSEKQALDDADKLPAEQRVEERQKVYRVVKQRIWDSQNSKKRDAEAALDSLESQTPQSGDPIESEVSAYKGRLRSASGYAQYLYARDLPANEDQSFDKLCKFAILELRKSEANRPNDYAVLQNLAIVLGDDRRDPRGRDIEEVKRLVERSLELKPRDYYGHQLLAQTILRGARLWGSELVSISETEKAVKAAEQARALRPESTSLLPVLIAAYSLRWEVAPTDRDVLSNKIETILGLAKRFRTSGVAIDQARIQWYVVGLRNSVDQSKFDANKELLVKLLAGLKGSIEQLAPSSWERQQVEERLKGFEDVLKTTTFADRRALAWPA